MTVPATEPPATGTGAASDRMLLAFVRLWALALLLHVCMADRHRLDTVWGIAVAALAFAVLIRPADLRLFGVLLVAQLADMVAEMPYSPNHWMLDGFVGLTILACFALRREVTFDALRRAVPGIRIVLLIAYSAAALAKYNTTFLDPVTSCASAIASRASFGVTRDLPLDPAWMLVTITAESLIPILLLVPATRRHGVRVGMVFHCLITLSPAIGVQDFSATLIALFFLFLSAPDAEHLLDRLQRLTGKSAVVRDVRRFPHVAALLGLAVIGFAGYVSVAAASAATNVISKVVLVAIVIAAVWSWRQAAPTARLSGITWIHVPMIVLTLFWAMNPYLGLRTTASFTMFSSLRTEGTEANHLFLPSVHLTDWQEDLVYIESSNDREIERAARSDVAVPLLALRSRAMDDADLVVTGVLHGERVTFGPEPDQHPLDPLTWWERKYTHFHAIPVGDRPFCTD